MKKHISRRDFLKLAGLAPFGLMGPPIARTLRQGSQFLQSDKKNVLVIVFDSFSALNAGLYGYGRENTPNLAKLAKRAVVYHNHFAGGNYTTPGTASLLTMSHPWSHRAFRFRSEVRDEYAEKSVFHLFDDYHRIAYTHNPLANTLLLQFQPDIDEYVPRQSLFVVNDNLINSLFFKDEDIATVGWSRAMKSGEFGYSYSLFLTHLYEKYQKNKIVSYQDMYPNGLPSAEGGNYYVPEEGIDWLRNRVTELPEPFFGYFHYLPPHFPYKPRTEFIDTFQNDSFKPLDKPQDLFTEGNAYESLAKARTYYDEFILHVDSEFKRLFDTLESSGLLENTWVVFTSDHGEMQERGISGHVTPTLYQPIVRVPLMIFEPGNTTGRDVYTPTSAVDVMPTLLHMTGHNIPSWSEGTILPPYGDQIKTNTRDIYTVQARDNDAVLPLYEVSIQHVQDNYKLIYYLGYEQLLSTGGEHHQLFDIQSDPEELVDISKTKRETAAELLQKVKTKLEETNKPFQPD